MWLMTVATGLAVAGNYYAQPLLPEISRELGIRAASAGSIITTAQLGYALGLLLIVPLGDMLERRRLILVMMLLASGGLLISATAGSISQLLLGTAMAGCVRWWRKSCCHWVPAWPAKPSVAGWWAPS
jgi:predicted MFS family arabinose efflux permease